MFYYCKLLHFVILLNYRKVGENMAKRFKRTLPSQQKQKQAERLVKQTQRNISEVNSKLQSLARKNQVKNVWATRVLNEKLDSASLKKLNLIDKSGRLKRLPKTLTKGQLKAINRATENFLISETSTKKGISKAEQKARNSIKDILGNEGNDIPDVEKKISDKEAETFRRFFWDKDFENLSDKMEYKTAMKEIKKSIDKRESKEEFFKRIENYVDFGNDKDFKRTLKNIYDKYVKS